MKKQKPLNKKHYKDDYKYDKKLVSKEERRLANWELDKEDFEQIFESVHNPKYNEKLAQALKRKLQFD